MIEFELKTEYIELCNLLKIANLVATGGHAKIVIAEGEVLLDGEVETRKRKKVSKGSVVEYEGSTIKVI